MNSTNETSFEEAIYNGDLAAVQRLVGRGVDINPNNNEIAPIIVAAGEGHINVVLFLIEKGADINAIFGETALYRAAFHSHFEVVELLLQHGAEPNTKSFGNPLLYQLAYNANTKMIKLLIEHGADVNIKGGPDFPLPICTAIEEGHQATVELLLDNGAKVSATSVMYSANVAAEKCDFETIKLLLEKSNWNPNPKKTKNKTIAGPLHYSIKSSCIDLVQLLIEHKANVNLHATHPGECTQQGIWDKKPLELVKFLAHPELVKILKDAGAEK